MNKVLHFFLGSLRTVSDFTEDDVSVHLSHFNFNRNLYNLTFDETCSWQNDINLFLQACITSINILSYYIDEESIYYRNRCVFDTLTFTTRLLYTKMRYNNMEFYECDDVYNIFTVLLVAMREFCYDQSGVYDQQILGIDFDTYLQYFRMRTSDVFSVPHGGGGGGGKKDHYHHQPHENIYPNYKRYAILCHDFVQTIKL